MSVEIIVALIMAITPVLGNFCLEILRNKRLPPQPVQPSILLPNSVVRENINRIKESRRNWIITAIIALILFFSGYSISKVIYNPEANTATVNLETATAQTPTPVDKGPCPDRQKIEMGETILVEVQEGYVAYFAGWEFDGQDKGVFVTMNGPYVGTHTFRNGVYCPPIDEKNEDQIRATINLLETGCSHSEGGCSKRITLP